MIDECSGGTEPGSSNRGVNWMQVCQDFEQYIAEPRGTLVTSENRLTTEGIHIFP